MKFNRNLALSTVEENESNMSHSTLKNYARALNSSAKSKLKKKDLNEESLTGSGGPSTEMQLICLETIPVSEESDEDQSIMSREKSPTLRLPGFSGATTRTNSKKGSMLAPHSVDSVGAAAKYYS